MVIIIHHLLGTHLLVSNPEVKVYCFAFSSCHDLAMIFAAVPSNKKILSKAGTGLSHCIYAGFIIMLIGHIHDIVIICNEVIN
jgi:hypothetical protein